MTNDIAAAESDFDAGAAENERGLVGFAAVLEIYKHQACLTVEPSRQNWRPTFLGNRKL